MRRSWLSARRSRRVRGAGLVVCGRWAAPAAALACCVSLATASAAQAVVVDMNASGQSAVPYNSADQSGYYGVAMVPGPGGDLSSAGIPVVNDNATCITPRLSPALTPVAQGLCSHGGGVLHANEAFALTWDAYHRDWATTRAYVEQFMRDVADGSGTLTSPYALTSQYTDAHGRAGNNSVYGGGCVDSGTWLCSGSAAGTGHGQSYPANGCSPSGSDNFVQNASGEYGDAVPNDTCLTDAQLRGEVAYITQHANLEQHTAQGHSPVVVLFTPHGVVDCLDGAGKLCSANGASPAQFCSYHSHVEVNGEDITYVVQPWTAATGCDEPDIPALPDYPTAQQRAVDVGSRLVSPLSQSEIAAIVNPALNGWFANDGSEIDDNGCKPLSHGLDTALVGNSSQNPYFLRREFNNGGLLSDDPNALVCAPNVSLAPAFVPPSAVAAGDLVALDGSITASTLGVPDGAYVWDFGDGTKRTGPSLIHTFPYGDTYHVKLTVTDNGGYTSSVTQALTVTGAPAPGPTPVPTGSGGSGSGGTHPALSVKLRLMPQSFGAMLRYGMTLRVTSNSKADGIVTITIPRAAARRAGIAAPSDPVTIGRGTVNGQIKAGTITMHLGFSSTVAAKLKRLGTVTLTVHMSLVGSGGQRVRLAVAGRY